MRDCKMISVAWELIGAVILAIVALFMFKGDDFITTRAETSVAAFELCREDPQCYMTYEDYKDIATAVEWLEREE